MYFRGPAEVTLFLTVSLVTCVHVLSLDRTSANELLNDASAETETCLSSEPFEAKCLKNEVILMTSASYGRMRIGRCLASEGDVTKYGHDPLFLGCSVDVLSILDKRCSTRNECNFRLFSEPELETLRPCHAFLKNYLEASYKCISVVEDDRSCTVQAQQEARYVVQSSTQSSLSCGATSRPWNVEADQGQKIIISMITLGKRSSLQTQVSSKDSCINYGYVLERGQRNNLSDCRRDQRNFDLFVSKTNQIGVVLTTNNERKYENGSMIFGFRAVGCSSLVPPEDTWLRRNENEAVIGCYSSHQTWRLHCLNNLWRGVIGNCTREDAISVGEIVSEKIRVDNEVLVILSIIFVGLIICTIIIVCGAICLKRYKVKTTSKLPLSATDNKTSGWSAPHPQNRLLECDALTA